ncbi:MAG: hypothetical protein JOZ47_14060 [Kutzneria sp.]|nr:hypothetical protein [Kutzneria sp.]MBV9846176.1 hypothetical protein [Kutzneria sp.]
MGKKGNQVFREAKADLAALGKQMRQRGQREETPEWVAANDRVIEAAQHFSRWRRG